MKKVLLLLLAVVGLACQLEAATGNNERRQRRLGANGHGRAKVRRGGGGYNGGGIRRRAALGRGGAGTQKKFGQEANTYTPLWLPQPKSAGRKGSVSPAERARANAVLDAFLEAFKKQDLPAAAKLFKGFDTPVEVAQIFGQASKENIVAVVSALIQTIAPFMNMVDAVEAQQNVMDMRPVGDQVASSQVATDPIMGGYVRSPGYQQMLKDVPPAIAQPTIVSSSEGILKK